MRKPKHYSLAAVILLIAASSAARQTDDAISPEVRAKIEANVDATEIEEWK